MTLTVLLELRPVFVIASDWFITSTNQKSIRKLEKAAKLLGTFTNVSVGFLLQTLEKNLMSNLKNVKSFNERAKGENHEFASGRKFEKDKAVRGEVDDDNQVISRGACGAFIHGLEDEFRSVRVASISSLCELAIKGNPNPDITLGYGSRALNSISG